MDGPSPELPPPQALGADGPQDEATFEALEARLARARGASGGDAAVAAQDLGRLDADVRAFDRDLSARSPEIAAGRSGAGLADLCRWRSQIDRLGLEEAGRQASDLAGRFLEDAARRWHRQALAASEEGDAEACFDLLRAATDLDMEALRRGVGDGVALPAGDRDALRDAFASALASTPPSPSQREAWTTALLDRADVVLTAIDDLDPHAASRQLDVVAGEIGWYLAHVETARGERRRRLAKKKRRLEAERQERDLQSRLEGMFGTRAVGRFERLILGLIFLVLGLLVIETVTHPPPQVLFWFTVADTLSCFVFLWDFFFRLAIVHKPRWRWFLRHFLVDLIPSLPVGILTLHTYGADPIRAGRAIRLLRLTRVARYARVLMPVIRTIRAFGFLTRGTDRIVRRYGHLLNQDIILYPTRAEKRRSVAREDGQGRRLLRLESEVADLWDDLLVSAPPATRGEIAQLRLEGLALSRDGETVSARAVPAARIDETMGAREITAEALIHRLEQATPEGIEAAQGADFVSRIARGLRVFSRGPFRWIPFLGRYIPPLGVRMGDGEVAAAAAHHLAGRMRQYLDRWFFFGDLYGTVTPAQFVDRIGATLVKSAFRPAYRLVLFGAGLLLVELLLSVAPTEFLQDASHWLGRLVNPLIILGAVAVLVLTLGWWLQRVAGEATSFLEQTAAAQFLPLMESVKGRFLGRDGALLARRILAPETRLEGKEPVGEEHAIRVAFRRGVHDWLLEAQPSGIVRGSFDALERAVLLYRDGMDGAPFDTTDTRTTNQLLGNPALRTLYRTAACVTPREAKALRALDLSGQRRVFSGPYLWFSLITRSTTHAMARLVVEYNRHAIPLAELPLAAPAARARREAWLGMSREEMPPEEAKRAAEEHVTTAFTALHFLDDDPRRDQEVEERFGVEVLARMKRDRRALFRRIFGTYPLHTRPHQQRVVNLYRLYESWLAGGRALLLPLRGLWGMVQWVRRIVAWVIQAVKEIRSPRLRDDPSREVEADFQTAVRKINRMRGPVVDASLWLRARVDCEYLGVRVPGAQWTGLEAFGVQQDLAFLAAPAAFRRQIEEERDLAQADIRELAARIDAGLLRGAGGRLGISETTFTAEHRRALAFAWRADILRVRSLIAAPTILQETMLLAATRPMPEPTGLPQLARWWAFRKWWRQHGVGGHLERRATWRAVRADFNGASRALDVLRDQTPEAARIEGERRVAELLRHPARLSEQLVTLRIVQVLGLIDVLNYRNHVWRLGRYADDEDAEDGAALADMLTLPGAGHDA